MLRCYWESGVGPFVANVFSCTRNMWLLLFQSIVVLGRLASAHSMEQDVAVEWLAVLFRPHVVSAFAGTIETERRMLSTHSLEHETEALPEAHF